MLRSGRSVSPRLATLRLTSLLSVLLLFSPTVLSVGSQPSSDAPVDGRACGRSDADLGQGSGGGFTGDGRDTASVVPSEDDCDDEYTFAGKWHMYATSSCTRRCAVA